MSELRGKLKAFTEGIDNAWEDYVYDRTTELPTLFDTDEINEKWLTYLAPLLGFTADLSFDASAEELRRILKNAVTYWNNKPSEHGVIENAIRMVTGNRMRIANYFDFRMVTGETVITEELEDFDPSVIDFPANILNGSELSFVDSPPGPPYSKQFSIADLPAAILQGSVFATADQFKWLVIDADTFATPPQANVGIYKIDFLVPGTSGGQILAEFPSPHTSGLARWRLLGYSDDYVTEVRLVDPGAGTLPFDERNATAFVVGHMVTGQTTGARAIITNVDGGLSGTLTLRSIYRRFINDEIIKAQNGAEARAKVKLQDVLNRDLLAFLINTPRPISERVDIVYINFLDRFKVATDLTQWAVTPTGGVNVPEPGGYAAFVAGGRIIDVDAQGDFWGDQTTVWKFEADTALTIVEFTFHTQDATDHYFVRVDYSTNQIKLFRKVSGADTQLGSTITVPVMKPGVQDTIRIDCLEEGTAMRIRVKYCGETKIDTTDPTKTFVDGRVGAYANASTFKLELVEVNVLPAEVGRIGPNP